MGLLALTALVVVTRSAADADTSAYSLPSTGTVPVSVRGNGHGHGMSQYGAYGAARQGLSAAQILAFYYPGATLTTLPASTIRVLISEAGSTTVVAAAAGLSVTGVGALPTSGISRYRLVSTGSTLTLQKLTGSTWVTTNTGLPNGATFSRGAGVQVYFSDGSSTLYWGSVTSLVSGTSTQTVNVVGLDQYAQGVAPREVPASWPTAAVQAQAIAARTYGRNAVEAHGSSVYDICDTPSCQVYGGQVHYNSSGAVQWTDDPAAISGNSNQVLRGGGSTIFAQFSASDGGYTAAGGYSYLPGKVDPYDTSAIDPYFQNTVDPSVAGIASYFGLAKATAITITGRDGNGTWGGRVTTATVSGVNSSGASVQLQVSGSSLAGALGAPSTLFTFADQLPIGHFDTLTPVPSTGTFQMTGWAMDPDHPTVSVAIHIYVDSNLYVVWANLGRPDVQKAYGTSSDAYGYITTVPVPTGTHTVCAYAIDLDNGNMHTLLGCRTVTVTDKYPAIGHVDIMRTTGQPGQVLVAGWVLDRDDPNTSPISRVLVNGNVVAAATANFARPDVSKAFGTSYNIYGYNQLVDVPAGRQQVCEAGVDVETGVSDQIACQWLTVPQ